MRPSPPLGGRPARRAAPAGSRHLGTDTAAVLLLDPERNELLARAAKGIEEEWSVASGSRSGSSTARVCTASLCSRSCSRAPTAIVPVRATGWEHRADA